MSERGERITNPEARFERSDMSVLVIAAIAAAVLLYVILAPIILARVYHSSLGDVDRSPAVKPPAPVLQIDPIADLGKFEAQQTAQLESYGWVDRGKGIARIPIEQAMQDIAARGIPDFPKAQP